MRSRPNPTFTSAEAIVLVAVGLWVFATRLWLIQTWGSPLPFWDQWDAEALALYRPWLEGTFNLSQLLAPHNEHRIAFTRVSSLLLFIIAGEWQPWWQLLLNGVLHATTAVAAAGVLAAGLSPGRARAGLLVFTAACFALPAGWQNALWGFQSQVLFTNLLAAFAIAGLFSSHAGIRWLAFAAGALAPFGNASGLLVFPAALLPAMLFAWRRSADGWWKWWFPVGIAVAGAALSALAVDFPGHQPLHARTWREFSAVFASALAWPWIEQPWTLLVLWFPTLAWIFSRLREREWSRADLVALGFVAWTVFQAAAIAYTRGAGLPDHRPLSRYQDPLLLGSVAQAYGALRLATQASRPARILLLLWSGVFAAGALALTTTNLSLHLPYKRAQDRTGMQIVRGYLATADPALLQNPARPHPQPASLQRVLDDPLLRPALPQALRSDEASPPWVVRKSPLLVLAAAILLGLATFRTAHSASPVHDAKAGRDLE